MNYENLAKIILGDIGGKDNIINLTRCMTRLRFKLKDESLANTEKIKNLEGVLTVIQSGGQYQVVIGNHVSDVYNEIIKICPVPGSTPENKASNASESSKEIEEKKKSTLSKLIDVISGVFTPIIGVLMATGIIKGLSVLFVAIGLISRDSGTFKILYAIGDSLIHFFPLYLGYTAANKFKMNPFIGMAIGASLMYPSLLDMTKGTPLYTIFEGTLFQSNVFGDFLGIPLIMVNYTSSVIPVIIATYFASMLERKLLKIIPQILKTVFVPMLTLIIIVPLTFLAIGPFSTWLSSLLSSLSITIYNFSPVIAGLFIGGLWQIFIMFGLHWGFVPIAINNIVNLGFDNVVTLGVFVPFVTSGVLFAVLLKSRDKKLKSIVAPALVSSIFGITEPALYGVTLPRKKLFIITIICNAISGAIAGFVGVKAYTIGATGIFAIPNYVNPQSGLDKGFYGYIATIVIGTILAFVLTWFFGFKDESINTNK